MHHLLSNTSSSLSGLAALTWEDLLTDKLSSMQENRKLLITKLISELYNILL